MKTNKTVKKETIINILPAKGYYTLANTRFRTSSPPFPRAGDKSPAQNTGGLTANKLSREGMFVNTISWESWDSMLQQDIAVSTSRQPNKPLLEKIAWEGEFTLRTRMNP